MQHYERCFIQDANGAIYWMQFPGRNSTLQGPSRYEISAAISRYLPPEIKI